MARSKSSLKVLGLCAVLVCVFSFSSTAQAEPNAFWLVQGAKIATLLPTLETQTNTGLTFLIKFSSFHIYVKCAAVNAVEAHLVEPLAQLLGKLVFKGCGFSMVLLPSNIEDKLNACLPSGSIETSPLTGLVKLHEGKGSLEIKPSEAGKPFAIILTGEECTFGNLAMRGTLFLKDSQGVLLSDVVKHSMEELTALSTLTINSLPTAVTLDGSFWLFLGAQHKNLTFAAHPG